MSTHKSLSIELSDGLPAGGRETLAVGVFSDGERLSAHEALGGHLRALCERVVSGGEFDGEEGTTLLIHAQAESDGDGARGASGNGAASALRVLLVGLGSRADFDAPALRRAGGAAVRSARTRSLSFVVPDAGGEGRVRVRVLAEGAHLGLYENDFYRNRDTDEAPRVERLTLVGAGVGEGLREELERARVVAESANWARTLADEPGLSLPPREFARRAAEMAAEVGLTVESLTAAEIRARGMGGLLGVAQGSDEEPALIVLRYEPEGASRDEELWAFVGKGITFDTGGISICTR
jgi:leucyl aminopeptidase